MAFSFRRDQFGIFDRNGTDQNRPPFLMKLLDLLDHRIPFLGKRAIDHVRRIKTHHRLIGRDLDDVERVNRQEFLSLGLGRTGHAAEFLVHAEVILQRDRRQRLIFTLDLDAFFCLDSLVQTVRPAASGHQTTGEIVNDNHLAVLHDVVMIGLIKRVCFQGLFDAMEQVHVAPGRRDLRRRGAFRLL